VQLIGRVREMAMTDDGLEVPQLADVHRRELIANRD
jgi:hypothetical protein